MTHFSQLVDRVWIAKTHRLFDQIDVHLEFKSEDDVNLLKEIFQIHGETVRNLEWSNWSEFILKEDDIIDLLNNLPNLEEMELSSWNVEFLKLESSVEKLLNLQKLKKLNLSSYKHFIVEFLEKHLPENVVEHLIIDRMTIPVDVLKKFYDKQKSIQNLDFDGSEYSDAGIFKNLRLTHLRCLINDSETQENQHEFLNALIRSQPELKYLDVFTSGCYCFSFVDGDNFNEITKLKFLDTLKMSIDEIPTELIVDIKKLKNLKHLQLEIGQKSSIETLNELSLLKLPIESLYLRLMNFEIPKNVYQQLGENHELKSLRIKLGTWHPITFFIESFPSLESLSIRFGEANNTVELSHVFSGEDLKIHEKIKNLDFTFWGSELITCEKLLKLLSSFPNLKNLKISSKFPFTAEFFNFLSLNLDRVKNLDITGIWVNRDEEYPKEVIESLKNLSGKFDFCHLLLQNVQNIRFRSESSSDEESPKKVKILRAFSFEPLKENLRDYFKFQEISWSNIRIHRQLKMKSGKKTSSHLVC